MISFSFVAPNVILSKQRHSWVSKHSLSTQTNTSSLIRSQNSPRAVISVEHSYRTEVEPQGDYIYKESNGLTFHQRARQLAQDGIMHASVTSTLISWYDSYKQAAFNNLRIRDDADKFTEAMFSTLLELSRRAATNPLQFQPAHSMIRQPFDYYKFSFDFASCLLERTASTVMGKHNVHLANDYVKQGHNVIFLSNHQSEGDPYAIDMLLDWVAGCERAFAEQIYFMAGDRVRDDLVVMPFSAGRNLLTVYSKKHINDVPELLEQKLSHNKRTISETRKLFKEGGHVVWLAPSGGRDRRNSTTGRVEISPFDESSIDMMKLTAMKSGTPCHFFPMALWTYDMMPPPNKVGGAEVGEERVSSHIPMHMYVGDEIDWKQIVSPDVVGKLDRRRAQRDYIERVVTQGYEAIGGYNY